MALSHIRSVLSSEGCWRNHAFPWNYSDTSFSANGSMLCPSCGTNVSYAWTHG
jgi:hypothetical protein